MGASAKQQTVTNFKNTVAGFTRLLGRTYKDPFVQRELKKFFLPNEVGQDSNGNVVIYVSNCKQVIYYLAELFFHLDTTLLAR